MTQGLANFGLSVAATITSFAIFFVIGGTTGYWNFALAPLSLGILSGGLFCWRHRPHFAAAAVLGLAAGVLGFFGGGPEIAGLAIAHWAAAMALIAVFWPVVDLFTGSGGA